MNKVKRKILGIFLSLSILATISLATKAKTKEDKFIYTVEFSYKGKDLEKDQNVNSAVLSNPLRRLKNKTSAKELVNIYAVILKIFEKYSLCKEDKMKLMDKVDVITTSPVRKELKLTGNANVYITKSEDESFKNYLFKKFNNDLKNFIITKKDLKNTQDYLINKIKKKIERLKNKLKNYEGYDIKTNKSKDLIEIGRISAKKLLKQYEKKKQELLNKEKMKTQNKEELEKFKKELENLGKIIPHHEEILKNDKEAEEEGKSACNTIRNYKNVLIPNMKKQNQQIKDVKYDDIKNLTKDLKVNLNKLNKKKLNTKDNIAESDIAEIL